MCIPLKVASYANFVLVGENSKYIDGDISVHEIRILDLIITEHGS